MDRFTYDAPDENATRLLGAALAEALPDGTTVALCGTLGAGKTRLVQAIAEAAGVDRRSVLSPTFVLIQEYHGRRTIYHIDAYRLRGPREFDSLGPDEYFEQGGLVLVEWADRVEASLPRQRIAVRIEVTGPESRRFEVMPIGQRYVETIERLRQRLEGESKVTHE
jgi:tRNA threonylcarbamoyladenosine biosynthesis protein TsaE